MVDIRKGREYLDICRETVIPALRSAGGQVLCLVNGLVGDPANAFLQMTTFPDFDTWQTAQEAYSTGRDHLVESEQVRLLRQVAYLPKGVPAPEDRRASFGYCEDRVAQTRAPKLRQGIPGTEVRAFESPCRSVPRIPSLAWSNSQNRSDSEQTLPLRRIFR